MDDVLKILENCKVNGDFHTHVSMMQPKGKFQINKDIIEEFWYQYCESISKNNSYGIAEKPQSYLPILVDVDLKKKRDDIDIEEKLYTMNQVEEIVRAYQEVLKNILLNCNDNHLTCFVFEKPSYIATYDGDKEYIKNGFHMHFINVFMSKSDQEIHLIPRVKKIINKSKMFEKIGIENSESVIDGSYLKNPWLLYGSKKNESAGAYKLTNIFNHERELIDIKEALSDYKIYDINEELIDIKDKYDFYLPRILSIIPWNREISELKPNLQTVLKFSLNKVKKEYKTHSNSENMKKCARLLNLIDDKRADDFNDWMHIGWAIYNISNGSAEGLNLWLDFSSRSVEKYNESHCINLWEKMERRNMTMGTIAHLAKQDNPVEYGKYIDEINVDNINQCIYGSHNDIAKALYEKYGTEFVCASIVQNKWYQYEDHHWRIIEDGVFLRKKISEDFAKKINDKSREVYNKMSSCQNDGEKALYSLEHKQIQKLLGNLKNSTYKTSVMKEAKEIFYNENFLKCLNKNPWLIGMKNGVYDLKTNQFRAGIPEDFISLQMPISYSEYEEGNALVKDVYDFLEKIFPDKNLREYFMDFASNIFVGGNIHKHVYFWSGEGDNGKSVTQLIFDKMFGEYAIKLPTSLLVGKRTQSSSACPELVRCGDGVRWCTLQEPDKKDIINIGILKELSGNDTFYGRGLFQEGKEIQPMFTLGVVCNDPPILEHSDKATWNRIRVIPFESTFVDDAPLTYEEQLLQKRFPKDRCFYEKIPLLIKPFVWVLLNHRKNGKGKFVEPDKVKCATAVYKKKNDVFQQFVDEKVTEDEKGQITLSELHVSFKDWYKESVSNNFNTTKMDVKDYYSKLWGNPSKGGIWKGYKLTTYEDEIKDGKILILGDEDLVKY